MPTEIQSLVAPTEAKSPRRTTSGVDSSRVAMIVAVLHARAGVDITSHDVYVATVGGAKTSEPAADLAMALALVSTATNRTIPRDLVAFGEVGLTGEIRATSGVQRRLSEAARLGFTRAIIPASGSDDIRGVPGLRIYPVSDLTAAIHLAMNAPSPSQ